jgi:hypothetical protein
MLGSMRSYSLVFQCNSNPTYSDYVANGYKPVGCGIGPIAVIYFYSYHFLVNMVFLNLVIGIIIQGFDEIKALEFRLFTNKSLEIYKDVWAEFDP